MVRHILPSTIRNVKKLVGREKMYVYNRANSANYYYTKSMETGDSLYFDWVI